MIKFRAKATIGNKTVFEKEGKFYSAVFDAEKELRNHLYQLVWGRNRTNPIEGVKGEVTMHISWECTMNRRAHKRAPDVIAAEEAARAAKSQEKREREAKLQAEANQRTLNLQKRIKQQVDHAFALGKHGTEPAAKYITCQHCDAPAAVVCLNQPIARGASVLDEDTIVGALCTPHIQATPYSYYSRRTSSNVVKVPCSRLEFFYDGVRQIAMKP
jgi:hypothetical protein